MRTKPAAQALAALLLSAASTAAFSDNPPLAGVASVIDGDTLEIHGQRIRLFGVDAFESSQWCGQGKDAWPCGRRAAQALADYIGRETVVCTPQGARSYDRIVARCYRNGRDDLASYMVREGLALDWVQYSMQYLGEQSQAKAAGKGAWSGTFIEPWTYRHSGAGATGQPSRNFQMPALPAPVAPQKVQP